MIDVNKIKANISKANKSMLEMGFEWDFIDKFWRETLNDAKNEGKA